MNNELKHSEIFLRSKIGEKNGFSTPENYFDGIEDSLSSALSENNFPKETSFNVPTDYFANLENEILAKVTSKVKEVKVISLKQRVLQFIPVAVAASFLLFIGINTFSKENATINDITSEELSSWFDNNSENLNSEELAMVFEPDDFDENELSDTTIDEINLEEYLNLIDSSSLLNEIE